MKENLTQHTNVPTPSRKTQIIYKGDEVSALEEILADYISILKHSYNQGLAAVASREYAIQHPEMIDHVKNDINSNPDNLDPEKFKEKIIDEIKSELEKMKQDLPHIDKAISRAIQLKSRIDDVLHINSQKENEDDTSTGAGELQDGDSTNK